MPAQKERARNISGCRALCTVQSDQLRSGTVLDCCPGDKMMPFDTHDRTILYVMFVHKVAQYIDIAGCILDNV